MSTPVRRHSTLPSKSGLNMKNRDSTPILSSPLRTEVRSPGFSSRLSALIHANSNSTGLLDSTRPRPCLASDGSLRNSLTLTPPPTSAQFNRATSCDRSFGPYQRINYNSPRTQLPRLSPRNSMSMMSPRNRRSLISNRSTSSPPPLSTLLYQSKSATVSPVVTVRVAPSQPFSPFRSTIQEPSSSSQTPPSRLHGMQQPIINGVNVNLPPGKITSGTCVTRGNDMHQGGASGCFKQSETGDKIDPRRVLAVLQELSRSRKRTRERERGRRLMGDCRDRGGNVVTVGGGDEEDEDDDEDDDDEDDDEEEEEEESGSKRARRDSSSSLGSSLSMDMPPLFSHNGVVGQTTSHLVASDHLSLNSLLSQSQSVYGHKGVLPNQSVGGPSHISSSSVPTTHVGGMTSHPQQNRSRKQKTVCNAIESSLSSSIGLRKRLREEQISDSDEEEFECYGKAQNLSKKQGISAPHIVSPTVTSPKVKKARMMSPKEVNTQPSDHVSITTHTVNKKTVAFADSSTDKISKLSKETSFREDSEVSHTPIIVLPKVSDIVKNSPNNGAEALTEEDLKKPLLSSPQAVKNDRERENKRVKKMLADVFDEPESEEENVNENNKENQHKGHPILSSNLLPSTSVTVPTFKFDESAKEPNVSAAVIAPSTEKSIVSEKTQGKEDSVPGPGEKTDTQKSTEQQKLENAPKSFQFGIMENTTLPPSLITTTSTPATVMPTITTSTPATTTATGLSGFSFGITTTKPEGIIQSSSVSNVTAVSHSTTAGGFNFVLSSKTSEPAKPTSSTLSSQSVSTALASPTFKGLTPSLDIQSSTNTTSKPSIPSVATTTPSTTGGFSFSFGKPGATSLSTLPPYSISTTNVTTELSKTTQSGVTSLSSVHTFSIPLSNTTTEPPKTSHNVSTMPPSAGFSFPSSSLSGGFSFNAGTTINVSNINTASKSTADHTFSTISTMAGNITRPSATFSFGDTSAGPAMPPTKTTASIVSPIVFGSEAKLQTITQPITKPSFTFSSVPSTQSATTATKPFTFDSTSTAKSNSSATSMFTFGQSSDDSTAAKPAAATPPFSFGTAGQAGANKSTFTFNKTPSTQTGTKMDAPFSFSSASSNKINPTSTLQPESPMSASPFAFGKTENKQNENATFSFVKPSSNANLPQGNIFQFATNQASNSSQGTAAAPSRADTAAFQFGATASTSTLQPSLPQKSYPFGPSTTSNSSEQFKFDTSTGSSTSGTAQPAPIFGSVKPTTTFGAASSTSPFGAAPSVTKPATATPNLFQFSPSSGTGPRTQLSGGSSGNSGVFKFGNTGSGAAATATSPFGATLAQQNAPPAFGSTTAGSPPGVGSQSTTGFNFTANANTAVPGVFQFGASSPPAANPAAAGSTFSFGSAIANATSFGTIPPVAQQGAPPGGNMFSIGTVGSSTNTKGRTIRTATRRRPK